MTECLRLFLKDLKISDLVGLMIKGIRGHSRYIGKTAVSHKQREYPLSKGQRFLFLKENILRDHL